MKPVYKIKKSKDFTYLYNNGRYYAGNELVVYAIKNNLPYNRMGVSVSKKIGNAVVRNRVKRLLRENYRLLLPNIKKGYDFVITGRVKANEADFFDIKKCMIASLKRGRLFINEKDIN